ncbi:NADPH:quinone reductase [Lactiplantibacillus garii]|uniref:NADPH:quinone reductase n=1 Tax=Lactiplantibacillus garii TaxID=2306423 RepID=A0A3R8J5S9_9LACO|nr:zinc-binding dehydrogenase [Lactiplantibacillus garii]RRK09386.1 NADPH:quinone reductase [Lactiplantibacillus garii]
MQAVIFDQFGDPTVLRTATLPVPPLTVNQVLVRVHAVAVDHVDTFVRSGAFKTPLAEPHVAGRDLVGTVAQVPTGETRFTVGERVWTNSAGYEGRMGATAEYVAVDADRLYPVPTGVDEQQLVAAVHSAATAAIVLNDVMRLTASQSILIEGAAGNVGRKFIQLAHELGASVTTTSNPADFERCRALGSDSTLDYHADFAAALQTADRQFDHVIDTSGRVPLQTNLDLLRLNGQVTLITAPRDNQFNFAVRPFYMAQKRIAGFVISHATGAQLGTAANWLNREFQRGRLLEDQVACRSFAQASAVHAALEAGEDYRQRFVLVPNQVD